MSMVFFIVSVTLFVFVNACFKTFDKLLSSYFTFSICPSNNHVFGL